MTMPALPPVGSVDWYDHYSALDARVRALPQTATQTPFTAVGGIAATHVQAALAELDAEKVALSTVGAASGVASLDANSKILDAQVKYPVGSGAALPTADASWRGRRFIVLGGAAVADTVHICLKTATDTYVWVQIATG